MNIFSRGVPIARIAKVAASLFASDNPNLDPKPRATLQKTVLMLS